MKNKGYSDTWFFTNFVGISSKFEFFLWKIWFSTMTCVRQWKFRCMVCFYYVILTSWKVYSIPPPKDWRFRTQILKVPPVLKKSRYWGETHKWNFLALVFSDFCSNFLWPSCKGTASPYGVKNASPWGGGILYMVTKFGF